MGGWGGRGQDLKAGPRAGGRGERDAGVTDVTSQLSKQWS